MTNNLSILSLLVKNEPAVLTRISSLIARRGFNIDSLAVGETHDKTISRMTITFRGDEYVKDQIVKQISKLHDVLKAELMDVTQMVARELLLVKVEAKNGERGEIVQAAQVFGANIIELSQESLTLEMSGEVSKVTEFIEFLKPYGIAELCRTGTTALGKGQYILNY